MRADAPARQAAARLGAPGPRRRELRAGDCKITLGRETARCYERGMETRDKTFLLRFTLAAEIPDALWEQEDFEEDAWLDEWEVGIKPGLIRAVFAHLRSAPAWSARVRNRGVSPLDEIEIVVSRRLGDGEDDDAAQ